METILQIIRFFILRKKYWMLPLVLFLALFGFLFIFVEGTAVAPFIYTVF